MRLVGSSLSKGIGALHRGVSGLATPRRVVPTPRTAEAGAAPNQGAAALALDLRASARQPSAKGANTARGSPGILASIYHRAASIMIPQAARKNPDVVSPDTKEKLTRAGSATGRPTGQYPAPIAESPHDREPDIGGESPSPSPRPKKKSFVENLRASFVGPGSVLDAARTATGQVSAKPLEKPRQRNMKSTSFYPPITFRPMHFLLLLGSACCGIRSVSKEYTAAVEQKQAGPGRRS